MPIVAVSLARWSATALTAAMHSTDPFTAHRRASALLAGALGAGGTTPRFVEPGSVESDVFHTGA
jgi:hypothetical protein